MVRLSDILRPPTTRSATIFCALLLATTLASAGCFADDTSSAERIVLPTAIPAPDGVRSDGAQVTLEVIDGGEVTGLVITDHRGFAVYGALGETKDALICVDDCVQSWIPVAPRSGTVDDRLDPNLYGAINRSDGIAQATYQDVPLYTWTGDTDVGITSGAGVAGIWFALTETGGFVSSE